MKLRKRKLLVILTFFIFLFMIMVTQVNAELILGKKASDGTRMIITYEDPDIQTMDKDKKIHFGGELPLRDGQLLEFQTLHVYFLLKDDYYRELNYTIFYYLIKTNETTLEKYFVEDENVTRTVRFQGNEYAVDVFDLRVDYEEVAVEIRYLDISYKFRHKTAEDYLYETLSKMTMQQRIWAYIGIMTTIAIFGVWSAGFIRNKAGGYFDIDTSAIFLIIVVIFNILMGYMVFIRFVSIKRVLFQVPLYVFFFLSYITTTILAIQLMNMKQDFWRLVTTDTKGLIKNSFALRPDITGKVWLEQGFWASVRRVFSLSSYDDTIKAGTFEVKKRTRTLIVSEKQKEKIKEYWEEKGADVSMTEANENGKVVITVTEEVELFHEDKHKHPVWEYRCKGDMYSREIECRKYNVHPSKLVAHWVWMLPIIISITGAAILTIAYNPPPRDPNAIIEMSDIIKISVWFFVLFLSLWSLGAQVVPGYIEFEPAIMHVALTQADAMHDLEIAKTLTEQLVTAQSECATLQATLEQKSFVKAEEMTSNYVSELLRIIEEGGEDD